MKQIAAAAPLVGKKKLVSAKGVRTIRPVALFRQLKPKSGESKKILLQAKKVNALRQYFNVVGYLSDRFEVDLLPLNDYTLLKVKTASIQYKFCMIDIEKSTHELLTFLYIDNDLNTQYATHNMSDLVAIEVIGD